MIALNVVVSSIGTELADQQDLIQELNEFQLALVGGGSGIVVVETPPPPPTKEGG